jgi:hypothetical protein
VCGGSFVDLVLLGFPFRIMDWIGFSGLNSTSNLPSHSEALQANDLKSFDFRGSIGFLLLKNT